MQTFLPYPDFEETAKCLDMRRLGKQRVECWQIYQALSGKTSAWLNHPATQMWKGYEDCLLWYMIHITDEWESRGYVNNLNMPRKILRNNGVLHFSVFLGRMPIWLGDKDFHDSHKSNLLRKKPEYYSLFDWKVKDDLPYFWPTKNGY